MLHTILHVISIVSFIFAGICAFGLVVLFLAARSVRRENKATKIVWQIPAVAFALMGFWLTVAMELGGR